ncbi:MAG TPA: hypothetical protein VEF04_08055 [Blastocatellia bacterium]|nr:hypothetical protein [Blastocatellia bacterium]
MSYEAGLLENVEPPCWRVAPIDFTKFLRHLPTLTPDNCVLCLEGVIDPAIESSLKKRQAANYENETKQGFLKLRAKIFYMPITEENIQGLADLSDGYAEPEVCSHLRVYWKRKVILSWHDLPTDPLYVLSELDESALQKFCEVLGCKYEFDYAEN